METQLKAGLWKTNVTPPLNLENKEEHSLAEIVDDMYANALVLDDGTTEIAIVSVDIAVIPTAVARDIRTAIEECCGIPAAHVTVSATHTHASPLLRTDEHDCYIEVLKQQAVTAVFMAQKAKQPVKIGVGRGVNDKQVHNRRLKRPDGRIVIKVFDFILKAAEEGKDKPLADIEIDLFALRLGQDVAIATIPGELFADYGLEIKAGSPFQYTFVAELTNGWVGYIPTLKAYEEGGYEVRKPASRMVQDAGIKITERSLDLLRALVQG